jgi:hypothetical protein
LPCAGPTATANAGAKIPKEQSTAAQCELLKRVSLTHGLWGIGTMDKDFDKFIANAMDAQVLRNGIFKKRWWWPFW